MSTIHSYTNDQRILDAPHKGLRKAREVNRKFKEAEREPKGYLGCLEEELVSSDFVGDTHSCVFDSSLTSVVDGTLVKVLGWYDNEYGYSLRVVDLIEFVGEKS